MDSDSESFDDSDSYVGGDCGYDDGHYHGYHSYHNNDYQDYEETDSYQSEEDIEEVYLEFDGASRGNPGRAGAGAVLKSEDGAVITRVREGLGIGTNNDAEYRALIRGLKTALDMGYDVIHVKGDSKLVCKQVRREWRIRNNRLAGYCDEAWELIDQFKEFNIRYCPRSQNTDADWEAQRAVNLPEGRIVREDNWH